jgi:hypothetical protein
MLPSLPPIDAGIGVEGGRLVSSFTLEGRGILAGANAREARE